MSHKRVAVLRGGPSAEYDVSMITGAAAIAALSELGYMVKDIIITRQGEWLDQGFVRNPEQLINGIDVAFLALHGAYGEDGTVQKIFERHRIPFTGSRSFPSAVAFNKILTKRALESHGIKMAKHQQLSQNDVTDVIETARAIASDFGPQYIIKPIASGSSVGTMFVRDAALLPQALEDALKQSGEVMVEEFIRGREATCGVLEGYRGERIYALPVVEIIPPDAAGFFNAEVKYNGATQEICPARFTYHEKAQIEEIARFVHDELGLSQYSRSDFILRDGRPYFLEVNTLPGLTAESLFPKAMKAVGGDLKQLIKHLIETAEC
ncbi:D-alanine--D-alanine ligase [Patescibacteria group bacterium]|nr:D-alanine--D-alanine ligase [Patescibacteria group bacterium]